jgi:2-C-methyl-D-erythritol 2,4-cyclodiphosphate synthase
VITTGIGYDCHQFAPDRRLVLGGVEIEHPLGLAGHSDADVLTHAIIDALLGAAGLGDIGQHFPDTDERYRDADSLELLRAAVALLTEGGAKR